MKEAAHTLSYQVTTDMDNTSPNRERALVLMETFLVDRSRSPFFDEFASLLFRETNNHPKAIESMLCTLHVLSHNVHNNLRHMSAADQTVICAFAYLLTVVNEHDEQETEVCTECYSSGDDEDLELVWIDILEAISSTVTLSSMQSTLEQIWNVALDYRDWVQPQILQEMENIERDIIASGKERFSQDVVKAFDEGPMGGLSAFNEAAKLVGLRCHDMLVLIQYRLYDIIRQLSPEVEELGVLPDPVENE